MICEHCKLETPIFIQHPTQDRMVQVDACFGDMLGAVVNACCGHGDPDKAYIRIERVNSNGTDGFCDILGANPPL